MIESSADHDQAEPADAPPMPELREGLLTIDDLNALCADLTQLTRIISIQTRARGSTNAQSAASTLDESFQQLWQGQFQAVQVRYFYDGHEWTDTLMRVPPHVRVIRCQHPGGEG